MAAPPKLAEAKPAGYLTYDPPTGGYGSYKTYDTPPGAAYGTYKTYNNLPPTYASYGSYRRDAAAEAPAA